MDFLKQMEDFIYKHFSNFFGNNSDFDRASKFYQIYLMYTQSKEYFF